MATIALLFHEFERNPAQYIVHHLAGFWRDAGHDVKYLFGTRRFEPADIILVHVNLSVVPERYLRFASRYPKALNGAIADVRKSRLSTLLLQQGDQWPGPVIVKSDLNYGGLPEKTLGRSWLERRSSFARRLRAAIERRLPNSNTPFSESAQYKVLDSISDVPPAWFSARDVVVEKFLPEMENGLYHLRIHQALGDRSSCFRLASGSPIVKAGNSIGGIDVDPHPEVIEWRRQLGLDYGKIDYVVIDGTPILLDVNKTTGANGTYLDSDDVRRRRQHLAEGLYTFFR